MKIWNLLTLQVCLVCVAEFSVAFVEKRKIRSLVSITRTYGICRQDPESCGALLECLGLANPERIGSWLYPHAPTIHQQYIPDTQPRVVWSCCTARAPARHNSTPELRTCQPDFPFRGAQTLPVDAVHSEGAWPACSAACLPGR